MSSGVESVALKREKDEGRSHLNLGELDDAAEVVEDGDRWRSTGVEARERLSRLVDEARWIGLALWISRRRERV